MGMDRRRFLKIAGVGALGLAGMPATRLFGKQAPSAAAGPPRASCQIAQAEHKQAFE